MLYNSFVHQAWPTSVMYINVGLTQLCNACQYLGSSGLTQFCNVFLSSAGTSFAMLQPVPVLQCLSNMACPSFAVIDVPQACTSFAYIGWCRLVPSLQANVHVGWTTFARVCDWTMCPRGVVMIWIVLVVSLGGLGVGWHGHWVCLSLLFSLLLLLPMPLSFALIWFSLRSLLSPLFSPLMWMRGRVVTRLPLCRWSSVPLPIGICSWCMSLAGVPHDTDNRHLSSIV